MESRKLYALALSYTLVFAGAGLTVELPFCFLQLRFVLGGFLALRMNTPALGASCACTFAWPGARVCGINFLFMVLLCRATTRPRICFGLIFAASSLPNSDLMMMVGDFNCRVGARLLGGALPEVLGPHGLGQRSHNGDLLLQFAVEQGLRLLIGFFQHDVSHTASWWHHRWHTPGVLDNAVCRQQHSQFVADVHAVPGAECYSDHKFMILCLRARPQQFTRPTSQSTSFAKRPQRLCVSKLKDCGSCAIFY